MILASVLRETTRDPYFVDEELLTASREVVDSLQRLYLRNGQQLPVEFREYQDQLEQVYNAKITTSTHDLVVMAQKSNSWLEANPSWGTDNERRYRALNLYIGIIDELKLRGVGEYEALKRKTRKSLADIAQEIFGDMLIPIKGGDDDE